MLFRGLIQWCKCGALYKKKIRKILYISFLRILISDPVGTQTQDLQNRNLTLYSTKLRDLFQIFAIAKVMQIKRNAK